MSNVPLRVDQLTPDEADFLRAIDDYKRFNRRPYPSWREVFEVFLSVGYSKTGPRGPVPRWQDLRDKFGYSD